MDGLDQRGTTTLSSEALSAPYDLKNAPELFTQDHILQQTEAPNAWLPVIPEYKKWEPVRHERKAKGRKKG